MFGFRKLETWHWGLEKRVGELEKEIEQLKITSRIRVDGGRVMYSGYGMPYREGAYIDTRDIVIHLMDKAGIELTYIEGKPEQAQRVGIQKKKKVSSKT